jgi:hypothetical protein
MVEYNYLPLLPLFLQMPLCNLDEFGFQQSNGFKTVSIFEKFTFGQMSYTLNAIFKNKKKA